MFIGDWLGRRESLSPNKIALVNTRRGDQMITYREWNRAANRTANLLLSLGVGTGDLVAVLATNCTEYLDVWFACGKLGAVMQTLNWRLTPRELSSLLLEATPRVLIYDTEFAAQAADIASSVPGIAHLISLEPEGDGGDFAARNACSNDAPPPVELTLDSPWAICYTGGTTGLPKGAVLTHGNITWNSVNTVMSWGLTPQDVTILNMPLFHTGGLNVLTAPLVHLGGTSIVCKSFDVDQVFDLIERGGVTLYFAVPTAFIAQQEHPRWASADFSRLRWVVSGGAPCPPPVFHKFWEKGVDFKMGYGLTESGPNTFWLRAEEVQRKPGSVGVPLFHVDVKVVDEAGQECAPGGVGELLIRGPQIVPGYWHRPEESAHAVRDGWLHTGDLASRDDEGYYYIVGRLKDVLISGGENVYPAEVEAVISEHEGVASVALIGVPDERWGEVGRAIVVPKSPGSLTEEALLQFCKGRLARFKVPKSVVFVDALPMTGAGKVDKLLLRERHGSPQIAAS